jgi:hypothetical protein
MSDIGMELLREIFMLVDSSVNVKMLKNPVNIVT